MSVPAPVPREGFCPLFLLSGATASGKSSCAHLLADRLGWRCLSMDSMMVYTGMDIGTAKPSLQERQRFRYAGLDLVSPGERFSTGDFLKGIRQQLTTEPTIAVGGTGLYFRAVIEGLGGQPASNPHRRQELEALDLTELQDCLRRLDSGRFATLQDPQNPRRLIRAIEDAETGLSSAPHWGNRAPHPVPVLHRSRENLNHRIEIRVQEMFEQGLLAETRSLMDRYPDWTGTSTQAIGYAEARAVLHDELSQQDAITRISTRTRQYAKRQRTWFRNQWESLWVNAEHASLDEVLDEIVLHWTGTGPVWFDLNA